MRAGGIFAAPERQRELSGNQNLSGILALDNEVNQVTTELIVLARETDSRGLSCNQLLQCLLRSHACIAFRRAPKVSNLGRIYVKQPKPAPTKTYGIAIDDFQ